MTLPRLGSHQGSCADNLYWCITPSLSSRFHLHQYYLISIHIYPLQSMYTPSLFTFSSWACGMSWGLVAMSSRHSASHPCHTTSSVCIYAYLTNGSSLPRMNKHRGITNTYIATSLVKIRETRTDVCKIHHNTRAPPSPASTPPIHRDTNHPDTFTCAAHAKMPPCLLRNVGRGTTMTPTWAHTVSGY